MQIAYIKNIWYCNVLIYLDIYEVGIEVNCGIGTQACDCNEAGLEFDSHSKILNIKYFCFFALVIRQSVMLSSVTQ